MEKFKLLLLIGIGLLGFCGTNIAQTRDTVMLDSVTKKKLDKKLIKLTKEVVLKHGPGYYREYKEPIINYRHVERNARDLSSSVLERNLGRVFYTVEYPYNREEESFNGSYSAKVYFWEDLTIFYVNFGHGMGIFNYATLSRTEKKNLVIPFTKHKPSRMVQDTIRDEKGNVINVIYRMRDD